ncbi:sensor histidine kinase [Butyricicoccus sp.]|uniref:sensor histidine kinase n=1 Tax=Butyricicoccus sp. TaxID=2049021 RepID=UPI003F157DB1
MVQGFSFGLYWLMVPRKRRWGNIKTYLLAIGMYYLYILCRIPVMLQNDSIGRFINNSAVSKSLELVLSVLSICISAFLVSKDTRKNKCMVAVAYIILMVASELVLIAVIVLLLKGDVWESSSVYHIGQSLFPIVFMTGTTLFAVYWNDIDRFIRRKIIFLSLFFSLSQCVLMFGMWAMNQDAMEENWRPYVLVCAAVAVLADFLIYDTFTAAVAAQKKEMELEQLRQQQETQYQYYQLVQANAQEMSKFRHDFKNQLQVVYSLLDTNKEETIHMLDEMNRRISSTHPVMYCAAPVVNSVITVKAAAARERGIAFEAAVDLDDWDIAEIDQSNLFSNLLDNALEGCLPGQPNQFISLKAGEKKGVYAIKVQNSCDPSKILKPGQMPDTAKTDKTHHGFGLKILQSIAEKYHGELKLHCENDMFTAEVFLENKQSFS